MPSRGATALTLPVPWGSGLRIKVYPVLSHLPVPQTAVLILSLVTALWGGQGHGEAGAQIGWSKDRATGAGKEGTREAVPAPGSWHQCQGDPAYLGTVLGTLAQGWLTSAQG